MRGMLWMDLKRMRWWLILCLVWGVVGTFVYDIWGRFGTAIVFFEVMLPIFAMTFVKRQVFADIQCGWMDHVAMLPHGKRKYALEKYLLLVCFIPVYVLGKSGSLLIYYWWGLGEWLGKYFLRFIDWEELLVFFCGFAALQMPVLLLSPKRYTKWETGTWAVLLPLVLWLRNVQTFAYKAELLRGNTISPDTFQKTTNIHWNTLPWKVMTWVAVVWFVATGVYTIWKVGKQSVHTGEPKSFRNRGKQWLALLLILAVTLSVVWVVDTHTPKSFLYVYTKPNWKGGLTYMTSNKSPEEVEEGYTYKTHYEGKTSVVLSSGLSGEYFLLWDDEWLLWNMNTNETKTLSLPYEGFRQSEEEALYWEKLLDSEEPLVVMIEKYSKEFLGIGFFSIPEDRMITDFVYQSCKDELIDGKIAAETEEGTWVLLDPYTGEIVEVLEEEPDT